MEDLDCDSYYNYFEFSDGDEENGELTNKGILKLQ